MAKAETQKDKPVIDKKPRIIKKKDDGTVVINSMPVILRAPDRSFKDVSDWLFSLRTAEQAIYANRTRLYDLYETVLLDGHLTGIMEKRIAAVLNKQIAFKKDDTEVEDMEPLIKGPKFRRMIRELMLKKFWGLTGLEFLPGAEFDFNIIPRKHIKLSAGIITKEQNDQTGMNYQGIWNLWIVGEEYDFGLLLKCSPYVIWKKGNMGDWAQYIEVFGQPVILTKYDAHDEKTKIELDTMMREAGSSLRLQIPNQANFEMHDGKTSNANGDLQDKFRKACNEEMSIIVLGATETTSSSNSSGFAQAKEHGKQQDETIKNDMADVLNLLNSPQFLNIMASYGHNVEGGYFCFEETVDLNEVQARLNVISQVKKLVPVDDDHIYEVTNVPKPDDYEAMKAEQQQAAQKIEQQQAQQPDPADPKKPAQKKKPAADEEDDSMEAKLKGLSFMQKLKLVFSEAR